MKDPIEILAHLLAAEEHPHLREEEAFQQAEQALKSSPDLQAKFAESKAFVNTHPVLVDMKGLPVDSRERIEAVLRKALKALPEGKVVSLSPWTVRKNFAWAAILALLLAGMSVISSTIIHQQDRKEKSVTEARKYPPADAFYDYAGQLAEGRMPLQYRQNGSTHLISWLEDQGASSFQPPSALLQKETMGCAYLDGPNGKVSLICFNTDTGIVHLFVTSSRSLEFQGAAVPRRTLINEREAVKWNDADNAYLLIAHEKDQELPDVFL